MFPSHSAIINACKVGAPRRTFLSAAMMTAAAVLLRDSPLAAGLQAFAQTNAPDLVHETANGLLAFMVPGTDAYSVAQEVSTDDPGGVDAGVTDIFIKSLDQSAPYLPQFSQVVAGLLINLGQAVNPGATGPFTSLFANLKFAEKVAVFQIMDATDSLKPLAGVLPALSAFLCYSEAGVFDPSTRSLTGQPVGWTIAHYEGAADGRDEFRGYFRNRR